MRRVMSLALSVVLSMAVLASAAAESPDHRVSYTDKTVLTTGSTDGLGRELARALAADGAHVIVHGRNAQRGQAVVDGITITGVGSATFLAADFASLDAVREFADTFAADGITMISLHPATLMDTTMVTGLGVPARTTVAEGRDTVMGLITAPTLQVGAYYEDADLAFARVLAL